MTINGVEYTDIIHTQVDVQVKILFAYASAVVQDFYFAQGVGIVKNITNQKLGDVSVTTTEITGYHIQ
jgi:hypothetical protein